MLYAKRNIPGESAKWDLQNKRYAKYTLEKRAHPNVATQHCCVII